MKHMVQDHKKDVELFQKMAKDGKDPELKSFAQELLPILQDHLRMAEEINRTVQAKG
jgi:putative membrane protein